MFCGQQEPTERSAQQLRKRPRLEHLSLDVEPASGEASSCMDDLHKWAPRNLGRLPPQMQAELASKFCSGVSLLEDYSGWGTVSTAGGQIETCLRNAGLLKSGIGLRVARAADIKEHCRRALPAHRGKSAPRCVFGDMLQRTSPDLSDQMQTMLDDAHKQVQTMKSEGRSERDAIASVAKALTRKVVLGTTASA